jgi:hypothetical protein
MECKKGKNKENCACTYELCQRRGMCCECVRYHRDREEIPGCFFSKKGEKTYDRSIDAFIKDKKI